MFVNMNEIISDRANSMLINPSFYLVPTRVLLLKKGERNFWHII